MSNRALNPWAIGESAEVLAILWDKSQVFGLSLLAKLSDDNDGISNLPPEMAWATKEIWFVATCRIWALEDRTQPATYETLLKHLRAVHSFIHTATNEKLQALAGEVING